jgi:hypothetical protein
MRSRAIGSSKGLFDPLLFARSSSCAEPHSIYWLFLFITSIRRLPSFCQCIVAANVPGIRWPAIGRKSKGGQYYTDLTPAFELRLEGV